MLPHPTPNILMARPFDICGPWHSMPYCIINSTCRQLGHLWLYAGLLCLWLWQFDTSYIALRVVYHSISGCKLTRNFIITVILFTCVNLAFLNELSVRFFKWTSILFNIVGAAMLYRVAHKLYWPWIASVTEWNVKVTYMMKVTYCQPKYSQISLTQTLTHYFC